MSDGEQQEPVELSDYTYTDENGNEVTVRLTEDEAKERGLVGGKSGSSGDDRPADKSRTPRNQ